MIYLIVVLLLLFYVISCFGCITYMVDQDIDVNILSLLIVLCQILNTYLACKSVNFKETIQKLKGGEK